jgi:hypothetical protein
MFDLIRSLHKSAMAYVCHGLVPLWPHSISGVFAQAKVLAQLSVWAIHELFHE